MNNAGNLCRQSTIAAATAAAAAAAAATAATAAAAAVSFTRAVQKQRGVQTLTDPMLLTHTIQLSWTLVPFSFLAGILYSASPALSATSRCPLRNVAIETKHWHKIVECFSII